MIVISVFSQWFSQLWSQLTLPTSTNSNISWRKPWWASSGFFNSPYLLYSSLTHQHHLKTPQMLKCIILLHLLTDPILKLMISKLCTICIVGSETKSSTMTYWHPNWRKSLETILNMHWFWDRRADSRHTHEQRSNHNFSWASSQNRSWSEMFHHRK